MKACKHSQQLLVKVLCQVFVWCTFMVPWLETVRALALKTYDSFWGGVSSIIFPYAQALIDYLRFKMIFCVCVTCHTSLSTSSCPWQHGFRKSWGNEIGDAPWLRFVATGLSLLEPQSYAFFVVDSKWATPALHQTFWVKIAVDMKLVSWCQTVKPRTPSNSPQVYQNEFPQKDWFNRCYDILCWYMIFTHIHI